MYLALSNLNDVDGNLITTGTRGIKPETLGDKPTLNRYLQLKAIRKQTAEDEDSAAEDEVIVTGEVTGEDKAAAEKKAVK